MKRALPWIVVLGILAIIALWVANVYNSFVAAEEEVESAWSQVENQYQRRADLVPNLVATVKGYAAHEQETLEGVIEARAKATQVTIDPAKATPEQLAAFQAAQGELPGPESQRELPRPAGTTRRHGEPHYRCTPALQRVGA